MKINLNNKIIQYLLAILGFLLLSYYIWFRFIRERLPRDIPFQLTTFTFVVLCTICGVYLYIIYRYFIPKNIDPYIYTIIVKLYKIYIPLYTLDNVIKNNKVIQNLQEQISRNLSSYLYKKYVEPSSSIYGNGYKFYMVHTILPKIIVLVLFMQDIFYFHKFYLIYSVLFLGIIPLIRGYLIYSIKQILEKDIQYLEKNYYILIIQEELPEGDDDFHLFYYIHLDSLRRLFDEDGFYDLRDFVELQASAMLLGGGCVPYKYDCVETWEARVSYAKEHNLFLEKTYDYTPASDEISIGLSKKFYELMPQIIYMQAFLESQDFLSKVKLIKRTNIIIIGIYLFCWIYILLISLYALEDMSLICKILELCSTYSNIVNPFSEL